MGEDFDLTPTGTISDLVDDVFHGKCRTCKHWDNLPIHRNQIGYCQLIQDDPREMPPDKQQMATIHYWYRDGDAFGSLCTLPGFGCIQWEPKK